VSTKSVMGITATGRRRNHSWPEALKREIVAARMAFCGCVRPRFKNIWIQINRQSYDDPKKPAETRVFLPFVDD
jgi:hypothetical protein